MHARSLIVRTLLVMTLLAIPSCGIDGPDQPAGSERTATDDAERKPRTPDPKDLEPGTPGPGTPDPSKPAPSEPAPNEPAPSGPGEGPPGRPDPDPADPDEPGTETLLRIGWVEPLAGQNRSEADRLRVHYQLPTPCSPGLREVTVSESSKRVTISLLRAPEPKDDGMPCTQVVVEKTTTVTLERPVGNRVVVDASTGAAARSGE